MSPRAGGGTMTPWILALDEGTTGATALVLDREGRVRGRGYREIPQHYPRPGWVEHEPDDLAGATFAAARAALSAAGLRSVRDVARRIAAIGLTNQRETTLLWDRRTSQPIHPAIVWQCRRTADLCKALREAGHEPRIRRQTGLVLDPYFSGTKLTWLLRHVKGAARRAARGELAFGTVDTWLIWRMTDGRAHVTDPTNASRTLLYRSDRLERARFDDGLLDLFEVPRAVLPEVRRSSGDFGATRGVRGLPDGLPILGVAGDQQAALYGQGCVTPGAVKNTYGTGCFLVSYTGARRIASRHGLVTTLACDADGGPAYALEGSVFIAGAAVQWLRDALGVITRASDIEALAASVPDALGTHFVPAFVGLGAPHWDSEARGAWIGLTRGAGRAHLARAVLDSIAWQSRDLLDAVVDDGAPRPRELRVDGGAAANDLLMQLQADALGLPVARPAIIETTALGAGMLAARALGWRDAFASARRVTARFQPRRARAERERALLAWRRAVESVRAAARSAATRPGPRR
ncbi:MAG: glycerol kinase GlpK [Candidatus Eisenbacteria bacterium]